MSMMPKRKMKPSQRKFFKTTIHVTVLSEDVPVEFSNLAELGHQIRDGDCCGKYEVKKQIRIQPHQAAQQLLRLGSEPGFFKLNGHGEDV